MLQVATSTGALGLSALVLRCGVQALSVEDGVLYRGALKFDDRRDQGGGDSGGVVGTVDREGEPLQLAQIRASE